MNVSINIENNAQLETLLDALTPDSNATLPEIETMYAKIGGIIDGLYQVSEDARIAFEAACVDATEANYSGGMVRIMNSPVSGARLTFTTRQHAQAFWFYVAEGCMTTNDRLACEAGTIHQNRKSGRFSLVLGITNDRVDAILSGL